MSVNGGDFERFYGGCGVNYGLMIMMMIIIIIIIITGDAGK